MDLGPSGVNVNLTGFVTLQRKVESKVFPVHSMNVRSVTRVNSSSHS